MNLIGSMTASSLRRLGAHACRLFLPTIADIIDVADATFTVLALMNNGSSCSTKSSKISDKRRRKRSRTTPLRDVAVQATKGPEVISALEAPTEVAAPLIVNPGIAVSVPVVTNLERPSTTDEVIKLSEEKNNTSIPDAVIKGTENSELARALNTSGTNEVDNHHSAETNTESIHKVEIALPVDIIVNDAPVLQIAKTEVEELHSYRHVLLVTPIIEIDFAQEIVDDLGASASSHHYNEFERFLAQDRMWGVPSPVKRVNRQMKRNKKTFGQPEKIGENITKASNDNAKVLPVSNKGIDIDAARVDIPHNPDTCIPSDADAHICMHQLPTKTDNLDETQQSNYYNNPDLPAIPEIIITEPSEVSPEDVDDTQPALESGSDIPTVASLLPFSGLYDYTTLNFTQEDLGDLWIMTILTRPGYPTEYVKLNCGFWYILEDKKNVRQMVEHEYEEFVQWISEVNTIGSAASQNSEPVNDEPEADENSRPKHLSTKWTPKPADQDSNGLEILGGPEENEYVAEGGGDDYEEEEEDWSELLRWKKRYELGRGWGIVKSFNHPAFTDRKYALGNDGKWYFEYKGKYRRLMEDEMDLLNSRLESEGSALVHASEEQPVASRWGLDAISEEEEEEF